MTQMVGLFEELPKEQQPLAGGKGGTLARLYQAGYAVPAGFVILPDAFTGDELKQEAWALIQSQLDRMRQAHDGTVSFAVRSSALSEDSAEASFAGEFETVLDVHSDEMIRAAIHTVRRSRHSERVQAYTKAMGTGATSEGFDHEVAVVVQRLIRAEVSGVLFTADPVSGSRQRMAGNFVYGYGEELVSGEAEPYTFTLERPKGHYDGPRELSRFAAGLFKLGERLEADLGSPQDIEWTIANKQLFLLQSRPITTLVAVDPLTGERNASLVGDYLWTNALSVEVFPVAATPSTRSVWQIVFARLSAGEEPPTFDWIAGRPYLNYSLMHSFLIKLLRSEDRARGVLETSVGLPPKETHIPPALLSLRKLLFEILPRELRTERTKQRLIKGRDEFLSSIPGRCRDLRHQITATGDKLALFALWSRNLQPLFLDLFTLQDAYNERFAAGTRALRKELLDMLDPRDADILLATMGSGAQNLASAGPILGLDQVRNGEMARAEYLERYGHRSPYENYMEEPRPYEDPDWIEAQLHGMSQDSMGVMARLQAREAESEAVWSVLQRDLTARQARRLWARFEKAAQICIAREATRSEMVRVTGVLRDFWLRAGELAGLGDDVFFLTIDELGDVLAGDPSPTATIPARRDTYERLRALPPTPTWIRGRFDPFQWAADPERRPDLFDAHRPPSRAPSSDSVQGNPGSAGRVEGPVRRIDSPEEGHLLQPGEILVTHTTNIGWTPLFPRAAAIVTDIGGALSHAAIVAREIGIPAVVGCGDATMRLRTGDRVRIDGSRGYVELINAD